MGDVPEKTKNNRYFQILVLALIIGLGIFQYRFYNQQKNENMALRIKILSMSETKKIPTPLAALINRKPELQKKVVPVEKIVLEQDQELILPDIDTSVLANLLKNQMKTVKTLSEKELYKNIEIANEIISREPNSYSSYKAKLISLLTLEGKYQSEVSDEEIESLLGSMSQFNLENESIARREAFVMATTNNEIMNFESQIENLEFERENLNSQLPELLEDTPEYESVILKIQSLLEQEEKLTTELNLVSQNSSPIKNEELVEIPFMRMMAQNDYEAVREGAQTLIDQFPQSPIAYYYLIKALEAEGQQEEVLNLIGNSNLPANAQAGLLERLNNAKTDDPKNYWMNLSF